MIQNNSQRGNRKNILLKLPISILTRKIGAKVVEFYFGGMFVQRLGGQHQQLSCQLNILQQQVHWMHHSQRPRTFEYSSLVMGSRDVPLSTFLHFQKKHSFNSTKTFIRKNQAQQQKHSRNRNPKIRSKNERPDIFLEGEQLTRVTTAWQQEIDIRYFQNVKDKMRRSTPNAIIKHVPNHTPSPIVIVKTIMDHRSTPSWTDTENDSPLICQTPQRRTANSLLRARSNPKAQSSRHSVSKDTQPRVRMKLEQRLMQRGQLKLQQSSKAVEQFKRKQLFYISQKDLSCIRSESFIVTEHPSRQIVTGYYFKKVVEIASLTKIMTFYTVMKILDLYQLDPQQEEVTIDEKAADMSGTSAELVEGDTYMVLELLYGMMLPSGNDAATALARWGGKTINGDLKDFIGLMNKQAIQLGMKSSTFGNPHGLPHPQNGSTAEEISVLVSKCLQFELFRTVIKCKVYRCWTTNQGVKREVVWENTNKLLRRSGFEGVKTGVTVTAGPCLASLYTFKGRSFIVILLRTSKMSRRFKETRWILSMCLKRMNFDGSLTEAVKDLNREDRDFDSDNSEDEQEFNFDRNDLFELDRRRKILVNDL